MSKDESFKRKCKKCGQWVYPIPSISGKLFTISQVDFDLTCWKWRVVRNGRSNYVFRQEGTGKNRRGVYFHRTIMNPPADRVVDHIDGDGLNNCRCNLRVVTSAENKKNRIHSRANCRPFISEYSGKYVVFYKKQMITARTLREAINWRDGLNDNSLDMCDLRKITKQRQSRKGTYNYSTMTVESARTLYENTDLSTRRLSEYFGVPKSTIGRWVKEVVKLVANTGT